MKKNPWLIDPTFTQFLTANQTEQTVFARLTKELKIGEHAPPGAESSKERPDLVFVLGNMGLGRLVIVELNAPNIKLDMDDLTQLKGYMERAEEWLEKAGKPFKVEGILIGSLDQHPQSEKGKVLRREIKKNITTRSPERVMDIVEVLNLTEEAHNELLAIYNKAAAVV